MRTRSMKEFMREHRKEIDQAIQGILRRPERTLNDEDRKRFILNDEGLYLWARREGVRI